MKRLSLWEKVILNKLSNIKKGELELVLPSKERIRFKGRALGVSADLQVYDYDVFKDLVFKGDIGLASSYIDGRWSTNDLKKLFRLALENEQELGALSGGFWFGTIKEKIKHFFLNKNSIKGSSKNIHYHYDLGNHFFSKWLDETMTYSSAYFGGDYNLALSKAQKLKYQKIIEALNVLPGDHLLEIGCGWGAFAKYALDAGFRVTSITISKEQYEFTCNQLKDEIKNKRAKVLLIDYRNVEGKYDGVVSIEMIEAIGEKYWMTYLKQVKMCLKKGGRFVFQGITINEKDFLSYRKGTDFIQQFIFPGGMLISEAKIQQMLIQLNMKVFKIDRFGNDYAETLKRWGKRFNEKSKELLEEGFDQRFQKMWNFYLGYCEEGFLKEKINVIHMGAINND